MIDNFFDLTKTAICITSTTKKPDPSLFRMHTHSECEIYYFISGKGVFNIEGTKYPLQSGDILIMNSHEAHYVDIAPALPYERCSIHFNKDFVKRIDKEGILLEPFENRVGGMYNLYRRKCFNDNTHLALINRLMSDTDKKQLKTEALLFPLLYEIYLAHKNVASMNLMIEETTIQQITRFINENLNSKITLDSLCDMFHLSKSQICASFKKVMGDSVWNYITIKRLSMARKLLEKGSAPSKVFFECGFSDYSTFFRAYKKHFGESPSRCYKHSR